jgi:hypothetical protein
MVCTKLKTRFSSYTSFHVLVDEDEFPLTNNAGVWPNGCLIAPFYGRLKAGALSAANIPLVPEDGSVSI